MRKNRSTHVGHAHTVQVKQCRCRRVFRRSKTSSVAEDKLEITHKIMKYCKQSVKGSGNIDHYLCAISRIVWAHCTCTRSTGHCHHHHHHRRRCERAVFAHSVVMLYRRHVSISCDVVFSPYVTTAAAVHRARTYTALPVPCVRGLHVYRPTAVFLILVASMHLSPRSCPMRLSRHARITTGRSCSQLHLGTRPCRSVCTCVSK